MQILGVEISIIAVLAAGVAGFIVGAIWYAPFLFGKVWQELAGISTTQAKSRMQIAMAAGFGINLVVAVVLSVVIELLSFRMAVALANDAAIVLAIVSALLIWFGFFLVPRLNEIAYGRSGINLVAIDMGYQLVNLVVMAVILVSI